MGELMRVGKSIRRSAARCQKVADHAEVLISQAQLRGAVRLNKDVRDGMGFRDGKEN